MSRLLIVVCLALVSGLAARGLPGVGHGALARPSERGSGSEPCQTAAGHGAASLPRASGRETVSSKLGPGAVCSGCSVVLVSIDTLRADHLGCYGYGRDTSPNIDRLASHSVLFERAYAASYVTADSHMSMFTSLYPSVHGVKNASAAERRALRLHPSIKTLPQILKEAGYATAAITGGGNMAPDFGFDRGMDGYQVIWNLDEAVSQGIAYVEENRHRPFFLFFHTYHVHDPYVPSPEMASRFAGEYTGKIETDPKKLRALQKDDSFAERRRAYWSLVNQDDPADVAHVVSLYDAEIREADEGLARLFEAVRGHAPQALLVVTSDHGEQFGEHGGFLHNGLYEELLRVPLMFDHPNLPQGLRLGNPVSLIDLAPTVLNMLGLPGDSQFQGRSLLGAGTGDLASADIIGEKTGRDVALISGSAKIIISVDQLPELYDLNADPAERHNLAWNLPLVLKVARKMGTIAQAHSRLYTSLRKRPSGEDLDRDLKQETVEQLRALGYAE